MATGTYCEEMISGNGSPQPVQHCVGRENLPNERIFTTFPSYANLLMYEIAEANRSNRGTTKQRLPDLGAHCIVVPEADWLGTIGRHACQAATLPEISVNF